MFNYIATRLARPVAGRPDYRCRWMRGIHQRLSKHGMDALFNDNEQNTDSSVLENGHKIRSSENLPRTNTPLDKPPRANVINTKATPV